MAKFTDIDLNRRAEIVPRKETKGFSDFVEGCEAIEIPAEDTAAFIDFISQSKFSAAIENDLQSVSEMADGSGALLSSWMSIADFREMIKDYNQDIADLSEKWQSLGANEIEINGFVKRTKKITIYPTSIKVSEGMTLDDLTVVEGFEELLNFNTPFERCKEIMDAFKSKDINIQVVIAPDGSTDENLISRDDIKKFLDASKSNIQYGIHFEKPISQGVIFGSRAASEKSLGVCGSNIGRVIDL